MPIWHLSCLVQPLNIWEKNKTKIRLDTNVNYNLWLLVLIYWSNKTWISSLMSLLDTVWIMWCGVSWPITSLNGGIVVKSRSTALCNGVSVVAFIKLIAMLVGINSVRLIRTEKPVIRWFLSCLCCRGRCSRCSCRWWFSCIAFSCSSCSGSSWRLNMLWMTCGDSNFYNLERLRNIYLCGWPRSCTCTNNFNIGTTVEFLLRSMSSSSAILITAPSVSGVIAPLKDTVVTLNVGNDQIEVKPFLKDILNTENVFSNQNWPWPT